MTHVLSADDEVNSLSNAGIGRQNSTEQAVFTEVVDGGALVDVSIARVTLPDIKADLIFKQIINYQTSIKKPKNRPMANLLKI